MSKYLAYPCGKMNQSFWMTNENYESLYQANLTKFRLFGASDFEFVHSVTGQNEAHKIGKTVTVNKGAGGFNVTTASYFKLDGENIFDVLEKKGYTFKTVLKLDIFHPELTLLDIKTNAVVATYKMNVLGEKQANVFGIGNKQRNIEITSDSEDLEGLFLGAFALSRVDFSLNTL